MATQLTHTHISLYIYTLQLKSSITTSALGWHIISYNIQHGRNMGILTAALLGASILGCIMIHRTPDEGLDWIEDIPGGTEKGEQHQRQRVSHPIVRTVSGLN